MLDIPPSDQPVFSDSSLSCFGGISRIGLHQFRNYETLDLAIQGQTIILTGPNGVGKTNILEAISLLSPGRGLRGAKLSEITSLPGLKQNRPATWAVAATLETPLGSTQVGTALNYTASGQERRLVKINGHLAKNQASLTESLNIIWVTPQMDRLFLDGASTRRKFIDRLLYALDPSHAERIHRYDHHLQERAHLLKERSYDPVWLSTLERHMAEDGVAIVVARDQKVKKLVAAQRTEKNCPFPDFQATMAGEIETWLEGRPALAVEDRYAETLKVSRRQDAERGGASLGPHRSDFIVHHANKQFPADLCSTGEQKMLLLAVTLAFTRLQTLEPLQPILLLLDEVAAHLDATHREALFEEICYPAKDYFQVWMTGTEDMSFQFLKGKGQFFKLQKVSLRTDVSSS